MEALRAKAELGSVEEMIEMAKNHYQKRGWTMPTTAGDQLVYQVRVQQALQAPDPSPDSAVHMSL